MRVTASILYNLVACPQRVALDAFGDPNERDEISPFVQLLWEKGSLFEKETIAALALPFLDLSHLEGAEKEQATLDAMRRGEPLIYSGRISSDELLGIPDLLRKEPGGYVPGDIKSGAGEEGGGDDAEGKPKLTYAVQLALYVDVLDQLGFSAGRRAFVWDVHGAEVLYDLDAPQGPKSPTTLWQEYQRTLNQARAILNRGCKPQGAYSSVCKMCVWYSHCLADLSEADDLTLIPQLGRSKRDVMQDTLPTVADLAEANLDGFIQGKKTIFRGIGPDTLKAFQARARLLKTANAKPYLKAPVQLPLLPLELFFDIEVDPMRDICYLHGFVERRNGDNAAERFVYFFADEPTAAAEQRAFAGAWAYIKSSRPAGIFYYSKYERTLYRKLQAKYAHVCSADEIEELFDPMRSPTIDLYFDVVLRATEWPTRDYSIKTLARYLGFKWRDTNPSGAASIEWYDQWVNSNESTVKQRILTYNEDDCVATRVLLDGVRRLRI